MTLPDVNVVVGAFRPESPCHDVCRRWLEAEVNGPAPYGMSPQVLCSALRILTHPSVFTIPDSLDAALEFCEILVSAPTCQIIQPGARHWSIFQDLCRKARVRGNLVQDAWLAALAIESGSEWITLDRGFARFPGVRWREPG